MSKKQAEAKAPRVTTTVQLVALFDQAGIEALPIGMVQDKAEAAGLNRTSPGSFYRWRATRLAGVAHVPVSSDSAAKVAAAEGRSTTPHPAHRRPC